MHHTPHIVLILPPDDADALLTALEIGCVDADDSPPLMRARNQLDDAISLSCWCRRWHSVPPQPHQAANCPSCRETPAPAPAPAPAAAA